MGNQGSRGRGGSGADQAAQGAAALLMRAADAKRGAHASDFSLSLHAHHGLPPGCCCLAFDPIHRIAAFGTSDGSVKVVGTEGVEILLHQRGQDDRPVPVTFLVFLPSQRRLVVVFSNSAVKIFDLESRRQVAALDATWTASRVTACFFPEHSQHCYLYLATDDGVVHVLNARDLYAINYTVAPEQAGVDSPDPRTGEPPEVVALSSSPIRDDHLLIAYEFGGVVLWDVAKRRVLRAFEAAPSPASAGAAVVEGDESSIKSVAWHAGGTQFAVGHEDGRIAVYRADRRAAVSSEFVDGGAGASGRRRAVRKLEWVVSPAWHKGPGCLVAAGGTLASDPAGVVVVWQDPPEGSPDFKPQAAWRAESSRSVVLPTGNGCSLLDFAVLYPPGCGPGATPAHPSGFLVLAGDPLAGDEPHAFVHPLPSAPPSPDGDPTVTGPGGRGGAPDMGCVWPPIAADPPRPLPQPVPTPPLLQTRLHVDDQRVTSWLVAPEEAGPALCAALASADRLRRAGGGAGTRAGDAVPDTCFPASSLPRDWLWPVCGGEFDCPGGSVGALRGPWEGSLRSAPARPRRVRLAGSPHLATADGFCGDIEEEESGIGDDDAAEEGGRDAIARERSRDGSDAAASASGSSSGGASAPADPKPSRKRAGTLSRFLHRVKGAPSRGAAGNAEADRGGDRHTGGRGRDDGGDDDGDGDGDDGGGDDDDDGDGDGLGLPDSVDDLPPLEGRAPAPSPARLSWASLAPEQRDAVRSTLAQRLGTDVGLRRALASGGGRATRRLLFTGHANGLVRVWCAPSAATVADVCAAVPGAAAVGVGAGAAAAADAAGAAGKPDAESSSSGEGAADAGAGSAPVEAPAGGDSPVAAAAAEAVLLEEAPPAAAPAAGAAIGVELRSPRSPSAPLTLVCEFDATAGLLRRPDEAQATALAWCPQRWALACGFHSGEIAVHKLLPRVAGEAEEGSGGHVRWALWQEISCHLSPVRHLALGGADSADPLASVDEDGNLSLTHLSGPAAGASDVLSLPASYKPPGGAPAAHPAARSLCFASLPGPDGRRCGRELLLAGLETGAVAAFDAASGAASFVQQLPPQIPGPVTAVLALGPSLVPLPSASSHPAETSDAAAGEEGAGDAGLAASAPRSRAEEAARSVGPAGAAVLRVPAAESRAAAVTAEEDAADRGCEWLLISAGAAVAIAPLTLPQGGGGEGGAPSAPLPVAAAMRLPSEIRSMGVAALAHRATPFAVAVDAQGAAYVLPLPRLGGARPLWSGRLLVYGEVPAAAMSAVGPGGELWMLLRGGEVVRATTARPGVRTVVYGAGGGAPGVATEVDEEPLPWAPRLVGTWVSAAVQRAVSASPSPKKGRARRFSVLPTGGGGGAGGGGGGGGGEGADLTRVFEEEAGPLHVKQLTGEGERAALLAGAAGGEKEEEGSAAGNEKTAADARERLRGAQDALAERGEKLNALHGVTRQVEEQSVAFEEAARQLAQEANKKSKSWWRA